LPGTLPGGNAEEGLGLQELITSRLLPPLKASPGRPAGRRPLRTQSLRHESEMKKRGVWAEGDIVRSVSEISWRTSVGKESSHGMPPGYSASVYVPVYGGHVVAEERRLLAAPLCGGKSQERAEIERVYPFVARPRSKHTR
jgi:hypothetical protein